MKRYSILMVAVALCVAVVFSLFNVPLALAQEVAAAAATAAAPAPTLADAALQQVCVGGAVPLPAMVGMVVAGLVAVASFLANMVPATSFLGKLLHWMALNITVKKT